MGFGPASAALAGLGRAITGRDLPETDREAETGPPAAAAAPPPRPDAPPKQPRKRRPRPRRADIFIAAAVGAVDLLGYTITMRSDSTAFTVTGALLLTLAAACLLVRRRHPILVLGAILAIQVVVNLVVHMPTHFSLSVVAALYTVGLACRPRTVALASLAVLAGQMTAYGNSEDSFVWTFTGDVTAIALVVGVSAGVRRWQKQVDVNRLLLADRAVTDERRRIARELHDIVAHHITTMHLMSGGARANLDRDPETARAALITLEASGRVALAEMRQLLGVLRSDDDGENAPSAPQPGVGDLDRLVAESCLAGLPTEFAATGEWRELPLPVQLAVFRIAQEALTNARKHAGAGARATVRLAYRPGRVTVEVRDTGGAKPDRPPSDAALPGSGHGLLGMRERVAVHGGFVDAGPTPDGGFRVAATIPTRETA